MFHCRGAQRCKKLDTLFRVSQHFILQCIASGNQAGEQHTTLTPLTELADIQNSSVIHRTGKSAWGMTGSPSPWFVACIIRHLSRKAKMRQTRCLPRRSVTCSSAAALA